MLLVPGLIAVAAGPLRYQLARGRSVRAPTTVSPSSPFGLVLLHIIPGSISLAGWTAAAAVPAGRAAPSQAARRLGWSAPEIPFNGL